MSNQRRTPNTPLNSTENAEYDATDDGGWFEPYAAHARTLRQWFVAFGIGAPIAFFANEKLAAVFATTPHAKRVVLLYLGAAGLQIVLSMIYKFYNSAHYLVHLKELRDDSWQFQLFHGLGRGFTAELVIDSLTVACFAWATWTAADEVIVAYQSSASAVKHASTSSDENTKPQSDFTSTPSTATPHISN